MGPKNFSTYNKEKINQIELFQIGIVVSKWNGDITENLFKGAYDTLLNQGVKQSKIIRCDVPGSFELVYGAKKLIEHTTLNAIIVIGSVIQGETKHFDFVCQGVTYGITNLNIKYNVPVIFCVLTDKSKRQSIDRSGGKNGNKGIEAAITAIEMAQLNQRFS